MDFYQAVAARRTVRDFEDRAIPAEVLERILDAGLRAPSNNHMREWAYIVLEDRTARLRAIEPILSELDVSDAAAFVDARGMTDERQRAMYFDAIPKQRRMLLTAGALVLPLFRQRSPLLKPDSLSSLNAFASVWCLIENVLLAAAAEGIMGVTRIPFDEEIMHVLRVLAIPDDYQIPCWLALGYPAAGQVEIQQVPVDVRERIHRNHW